MPSAVAARVAAGSGPGRGGRDMSDSVRVSVYLHGFPSRRAASSAMTSSGVTASLPPKPPPTSGAMTRILFSGMPAPARA